jgi:hypothetical protein
MENNFCSIVSRSEHWQDDIYTEFYEGYFTSSEVFGIPEADRSKRNRLKSDATSRIQLQALLFYIHWDTFMQVFISHTRSRNLTLKQRHVLNLTEQKIQRHDGRNKLTKLGQNVQKKLIQAANVRGQFSPELDAVLNTTNSAPTRLSTLSQVCRKF